MKTLDMADKYPPAESFDEDDGPTIKVQVPEFHHQVVVEADDPHGDRDTIPCPPSYPECVEGHETTYPGVGLLIVLGFGLTFWSLVAYFIFR